MGHTMLRYARPGSRNGASATGDVPFTPLWQPRRLLLRVRRHGVVVLQQPPVSRIASMRLRSAKRIFRASNLPQL